MTPHVTENDLEILRAIVEHCITCFEHMLVTNGIHIQHILPINGILYFEFEFLGLFGSSSHLVVKIWTAVFYCIFVLPMVHITYFQRFVEICPAEWSLRMSKHSNYNYNHTAFEPFCLDIVNFITFLLVLLCTIDQI